MQVLIKNGVKFEEINDHFLAILPVIYEVYNGFGLVPVITSANDGYHSTSSYHYLNCAWDLRIWNIQDPKAVADVIREKLRAIDPAYDVVIEKDHIHIEYDLRKAGKVS